MASNSRRQIEAWMKTIDVCDSVIDIGGLFMPAKGRTKSWDVTVYEILDIKPSRNGVIAKYVYDLNYPIHSFGEYHNAFCIEVADHFWNPIQAFSNINKLLKPEGLLYISSNFLFPHHTGFDCVRFTSTGLAKVLNETGFTVLSIVPRVAVDNTLTTAMQKESKVVYHPGDIGYMIKAKKI